MTWRRSALATEVAAAAETPAVRLMEQVRTALPAQRASQATATLRIQQAAQLSAALVLLQALAAHHPPLRLLRLTVRPQQQLHRHFKLLELSVRQARQAAPAPPAADVQLVRNVAMLRQLLRPLPRRVRLLSFIPAPLQSESVAVVQRPSPTPLPRAPHPRQVEWYQLLLRRLQHVQRAGAAAHGAALQPQRSLSRAASQRQPSLPQRLPTVTALCQRMLRQLALQTWQPQLPQHPPPHPLRLQLWRTWTWMRNTLQPLHLRLTTAARLLRTPVMSHMRAQAWLEPASRTPLPSMATQRKQPLATTTTTTTTSSSSRAASAGGLRPMRVPPCLQAVSRQMQRLLRLRQRPQLGRLLRLPQHRAWSYLL